MLAVAQSQETGEVSEWVPVAQQSALRLVRALAPTMTLKQLASVLGEDDAHSLVCGHLGTPTVVVDK